MPLYPDTGTLGADLAVAQGDINGLALRMTAAESKRSTLYTFTGAGDQVTMNDTSPKVFTKKATMPADAGSAYDHFDWEAEVGIDSSDSSPAMTGKLKMGAIELESKSITTADSGDYVIMRGHGRLLTAGASSSIRAYKGLGETKDTTLTQHTHEAPTNVSSGPATTAPIDFTVSMESAVGHTNNKATLNALRILHHKAA